MKAAETTKENDMTSPAPLTTPYAIIVGLDCITGLQTARILARRKIPVIGIARELKHYCCRTRVCKEIIAADTAGKPLIAALKQLGSRLSDRMCKGSEPLGHKPGVLVPCSDMAMLMISRHREELSPWFHILLPEADVVEMLTDKIRFVEFAQEKGLPIPKTFILRNRLDAEQAADQLTYPCVLKPPVKTPAWEQNARTKVFRVESAEELRSLYDRCCGWAAPLLVQEWVEGGESDLYSCNCYFSRSSEPLATFIARKIRQWPPATGTSCLGEECRNDIVLRDSLRLFQSVGYQGLGYVEMKQDRRTGKHFIIEPNIGRPTGRSAIAEAGGVELLYTMYCDAVGRPLPSKRQQHYRGAKWIYWRRDFQSAWYYWRRGELSLRQWWQSLRGRKVCAVLDWSDPGPFCGDLLKVVRGSVEVILARYGRKASVRRAGQEVPPALDRSGSLLTPTPAAGQVIE